MCPACICLCLTMSRTLSEFVPTAFFEAANTQALGPSESTEFDSSTEHNISTGSPNTRYVRALTSDQQITEVFIPEPLPAEGPDADEPVPVGPAWKKARAEKEVEEGEVIEDLEVIAVGRTLSEI